MRMSLRMLSLIIIAWTVGYRSEVRAQDFLQSQSGLLCPKLHGVFEATEGDPLPVEVDPYFRIYAGVRLGGPESARVIFQQIQDNLYLAQGTSRSFLQKSGFMGDEAFWKAKNHYLLFVEKSDLVKKESIIKLYAIPQGEAMRLNYSRITPGATELRWLSYQFLGAGKLFSSCQ